MTRFVLLAHLHRPGCTGPLNVSRLRAGVGANAERAAAAPQCLVVGVEERVFLKAAAFERSGAGREDGRSRFGDAVDQQLDLALDHEGPKDYSKNRKASGQSLRP